jgi:predicted phage tail protein
MAMRAVNDAPREPANLQFQVSGSTVVLTWSPSATGDAVDTYVIEAGTATGLSNIITFATGGRATTLTVTNVPNGTYLVRVRARNAEGNSGPSNEVTIVVGSCPAPDAPAGLTAMASGNTATLSWDTVAGALSFIIEAGSAPGAANLVAFDTGSTATSFTGNAPNGAYYLRVRVRTVCGTSAASNEAVLTVGGTAPPPVNLSGRWTQTRPRSCQQLPCGQTTVDFTHSGTSLTGTILGFPASFKLTHTGTSGTTLTFGGTFVITFPGGCSPATFSSAMTVDTVANTMNGSFTGRNTDCLTETNVFTLTKQ